MEEEQVGVRELKAHLSQYLRLVKEGRTVVVTERGKPIGRLVPAQQSLEARLRTMEQAGLIAWSGTKLSPVAPVARVRGNRTVSDLMSELRE